MKVWRVFAVVAAMLVVGGGAASAQGDRLFILGFEEPNGPGPVRSGIFELDPVTGEELNHFEEPPVGGFARIAFDGRFIYVVGDPGPLGPLNPNLARIDPDTGAVLSIQEFGDLPSRIQGIAALASGLYISQGSVLSTDERQVVDGLPFVVDFVFRIDPDTLAVLEEIRLVEAGGAAASRPLGAPLGSRWSTNTLFSFDYNCVFNPCQEWTGREIDPLTGLTEEMPIPAAPILNFSTLLTEANGQVLYYRPDEFPVTLPRSLVELDLVTGEEFFIADRYRIIDMATGPRLSNSIEVPTLGQFGALILGVLLAGLGAWRVRHQQ